MNILIIGNSAAGTAAIESIRQYDKESTILQLSDEASPLYSRCLLSYYLAGAITKEDLRFRDTDFHQTMNVQLHAGPGFRATELNPGKRQVICENGKSFTYDSLLLATGASAQLPSHLPSGIDGILGLRNLMDSLAIKEHLKTAKKAVVYGGGLIGIKAATALNQCGLKTTVIVRSNRVLSQMVDYDASQIITSQLQENEIEILPQADISEVISKNNRIVGIRTSQDQIIDCDLLIVAKGVTPNTQLIQGTDIVQDWGIKTNPHMQTNHPDIFAAGDVAQTFDIAIEDYTVNALWTCAIQQGRIAGLNIAGKSIDYNGAIGMNALNVCNTSLISFGITTPQDPATYEILTLNQPARGIYKKIVIGSNHRIKGIILLGKIANAGVLLSLIQRKIDITPFKDELLSNQFNFGKLIGHGGEPELQRYQNDELQ